MAAWAKDNNTTLYEVLMDIYSEFGLYDETMVSITKKGKQGADEIIEMMKTFRNNPPTELGNSKILKLIDYNSSTSKNLISGDIEAIDFPKSNVLQFITEDRTKISIRPSGTEPKIKFYFGVYKPNIQKSSFTEEMTSLVEKVSSIKEELHLS